MTLRTSTCALTLDIKSVSDAGVIEGYASVFDEKDYGGDIVARGAFKKSLKARGARGVKMLTDHRSENRVGVWEHLAEDSKGLIVKGRLLMEKQLAKDAYVDLKEGALDGLSIGYTTIADTMDRAKNARILKEVDLREISLVSFPMLDSARITAVKTLADLSQDDIREIEAAFRMKGLSRTDAVKAVSGLKDWLARDASAPNTDLRDEGTAEALAEMIRRNTAILSA